MMRKVATVLVDVLPDETYLRMVFPAHTGYLLHLKHPRTFNEKLQWLKLYNRHEEYTTMVDKVDAKNYVAERIGNKHIIPTIVVYDSVEQIDWRTLPDEFVMKCTHDSGSVIICKDKKQLDKADAERKMREGLSHTFTKYNKEYPYAGVKPRIIVEKLMHDSPETKDLPEHSGGNLNDSNKQICVGRISDNGGDLKDYKFFCFDGKVKFFKVDIDRFTRHHANYYTPDGILLPFGEKVCVPDPQKQLIMPDNLSEMIDYAEKLSAGIPFLRVDFYSVAGNVYFGELTFYPSSGFGAWTSVEVDCQIGYMLDIKNINKTI